MTNHGWQDEDDYIDNDKVVLAPWRGSDSNGPTNSGGRSIVDSEEDEDDDELDDEYDY